MPKTVGARHRFSRELTRLNSEIEAFVPGSIKGFLWYTCLTEEAFGSLRAPRAEAGRLDQVAPEVQLREASHLQSESRQTVLSQPIGVAAVVAAAGFSRRMGRFKPLLPWGRSTVIEASADALIGGGASPVLVVVGHRGAEIAERFAGATAGVVFNPDYARNEMLRSFQVGVEALLSENRPLGGSLLALGDQPHIPVAVVRSIIGYAAENADLIVVPSHNRRRGHPVFLPRRLFAELLRMKVGQSLRDLLNGHAEEIVYVDVEGDSVRRDMDLPAEYEALRAEFGGTE